MHDHIIRVAHESHIWLVTLRQLVPYLKLYLLGRPVMLAEYGGVPVRLARPGWQADKGEQSTVNLDALLRALDAEKQCQRLCGKLWELIHVPGAGCIGDDAGTLP
jgi:hypothetical protein